jgi:RNA polymerase sigma-70 factor (ECF subfamily)
MTNSESLALSVPVSDDKLLDAMSYKKADSAPARNQETDPTPWIKAAIRGDRSAMEKLFRHFKTPIYNLAYRYTYDAAAAEDILQDVFIKVFTHLEDIKNVDTFPAWLYRVAINASLTHLRSRKREIKKSVPMSAVEGRMAEATYDADTSHLRKPLDEAIDALSDRLKAVFVLHDVQGFKHEEIAGILGCTVGTSKSHLFKARMRIRIYLKTKSIEAS